MIWFDPYYFLYLAPALLLALWAQFRIRAAYAAAAEVPAPLTGAAAARHILDSAGLAHLAIEPIPGQLTDHYDPRDKVLRLSQDVYYGRSLAAVGIAAHEAGHALQHARAYTPLAIRSAIVPVANFGSGASIWMLIIGMLFHSPLLVWAGIIAFSGFVFFQLVNLPVEYNASSRAKAQLVQLGIVRPQEMVYVNRVLSAAALTYVAATLQAVLTLVYFISRFAGGERRSY